MNPEEVVQAGMDLRAKHVFGHHWATFRLTNEPMEEPGRRFLTEARKREWTVPERFRAFTPGGSWWISSNFEQAR